MWANNLRTKSQGTFSFKWFLVENSESRQIQNCFIKWVPFPTIILNFLNWRNLSNIINFNPNFPANTHIEAHAGGCTFNVFYRRKWISEGNIISVTFVNKVYWNNQYLVNTSGIYKHLKNTNIWVGEYVCVCIKHYLFNPSQCIIHIWVFENFCDNCKTPLPFQNLHTLVWNLSQYPWGTVGCLPRQYLLRGNLGMNEKDVLNQWCSDLGFHCLFLLETSRHSLRMSSR